MIVTSCDEGVLERLRSRMVGGAARIEQVAHKSANGSSHMNDPTPPCMCRGVYQARLPSPEFMTQTAPFRRAAVVGLGVVGIPVAAKIAESGIRTTGLDIDERRVASIREGRYPFESDEPGIDALIARVHDEGLLTATTDPETAIKDADVVIVVVQTPVEKDGQPRYGALKAALTGIGPHLAPGVLLVVESTLAPGTMKQVVQPTLEAASGKRAGKDFLLGHCPERVMPGKLLQNITRYDRVVGGMDPESTERMLQLYGSFVEGHLTPTDMTTAEVVKTTENAYRDVQIAFANEVARICQEVGADAWEVRRHVNLVEDRNMHMPGTGVGGHCITKDGLLLAYAAKGFEPQLLRTARRVNEEMPEATVRLVAEALGAHLDAAPEEVLQGRKVTILGASYLPGSDDTRDTPSLPIANTLKGRGAAVTLVDPYAEEPLGDHPVGADLEAALDGADVVLLSTAHKQYTAPDWPAWARRMRTLVAVDGRGAWAPGEARAAGFTYRGIGR